MTPRYAAPLAVVTLLLTACGSHETAPLTPGVDPAGSVTLTVHTAVSPGKDGEMFTEGSVSEIRLTAADGTVIEPQRDHVAVAVFPRLAPGSYRLGAALRPCDGNCGYLDSPTTPCASTVRVRADQEVTVRWRVGERCRVG
jgi:hypothetical protein